jgi:hypothetical protein
MTFVQRTSTVCATISLDWYISCWTIRSLVKTNSKYQLVRGQSHGHFVVFELGECLPAAQRIGLPVGIALAEAARTIMDPHQIRCQSPQTIMVVYTVLHWCGAGCKLYVKALALSSWDLLLPAGAPRCCVRTCMMSTLCDLARSAVCAHTVQTVSPTSYRPRIQPFFGRVHQHSVNLAQHKRFFFLVLV